MAPAAPHDQHTKDRRHDDTVIADIALERYSVSMSIRGDVITDGPFLVAQFRGRLTDE